MKSKRCIVFHNDLKPDEEDVFLQSGDNEEPILVVFRRKNVFYSAYIVGDGQVIFTEANNLAHSLILLAGVYKVAELSVPKIFAQFIGILNALIFGINWSNKEIKQSTGYVNVREQLENEMERGNISRGKGKQA